MARSTDPNDHKGLIQEAYRIEGITLPECRSIFLDWALSLPEERDQNTALTELHAAYALHSPDHPMTQVLSEGLQGGPNPETAWRLALSEPLGLFHRHIRD